MHGGQLCTSTTITSTTTPTGQFQLSCQRVNMGGKIDAPAKCEFRSVIRFPLEAAVAQQFLEQFKRNVSDHPVYSPDLTTSDFHLFPDFKNWLGASSNQLLHSNAKTSLTSLAATFFEEGMGNLVLGYDKCLNLHGDVVEK
ncbi:hypothetical protein AVEN_64134-1 [Araneus ventricosus]|uniref:Uncharacterized protein n=1 Tax=Araneus ventricosus TaxID=182803 RepID=A0A4Y2C3W1_ARAVE|nr:hypothetical protein AVEN_64134-1 [Araneus ventricosus]